MANLTKRDANHAAIRKALLDAGRPVKDCAVYPGLGCDLLTEHVAGHVVLLEIKDGDKPPSARRLTPREQELRDMFPGSFALVTTVAEAFAAVGLA